MKKYSIAPEQHKMALAMGQDVPNQRPFFPIRLNQVGITNKKVWVRLPFGLLEFDCTIVVDLPSERRGIHMSRMEEAVSSLHEEEFEDIARYGMELAARVVDEQEGNCVLVQLSGSVPAATQTKVSKRVSIDRVDMGVEVQVDGTVRAVKTKRCAAVYHITACPCTQVYAENLFTDFDQTLPTMTHSQRSRTSLAVDGTADLEYNHIIACLQRGLHVTQDLLKRPDEAEIVLQAHSMPQFAEDAVRAVAKEAGIMFGKKLPSGTLIEIESLSYESIHIHDVRCLLKTTLGEILEVMAREERHVKV